MLVLSRKRNESIIINDDITITIVDIRGENVRLGIEAPKETPVHRHEIYESINKGELGNISSRPHTPTDTNATTELVKLQNQNTQLKNHITNLIQQNTDQQGITNLEHQQELTKLQNQNIQLNHQLTELKTHHTNHCYELAGLQNNASNTERVITNLQDEITTLTDCKEHLRQLGQEICGCDHVENADERTEQTRHILETIRTNQQELAQLQDKITKLNEENHHQHQENYTLRQQNDNLQVDQNPTLNLCQKHNIIHTTSQGCYICNTENSKPRFKNKTPQ